MARQPESRLQRRIRKAIEQKFGGWWVKMWGGPFMPAGIPDLLGCIEGKFFALEVKRPIRSSKTSAIQDATIEDIRQCGGHSTVVRSVDEALAFVGAQVRQIAGQAPSRSIRASSHVEMVKPAPSQPASAAVISLEPAQQRAFEFVRGLDRAALFGEQRTGKTYITMALIDGLMSDDFCGLLVGPLSNLVSTWQVKLNSHIPQLQIFTDWEQFKKAKGPRLFLIHFESLPRLIDRLVRYKKFNWACIDEAHRIANRGSKQSRAAGRLSWIARKLILTGTPIEKYPSHLWAQFRFLDPRVFSTRWEDFETEYFDWRKVDLSKWPVGSSQWQRMLLQQRILRRQAEFRWDKLDQLTTLIRPLAYRLEQKDVGIIPAEIKKIRVPLGSIQRRLYDRMDRDSIIKVKGSRVTASLPVTQVMKLRQLASGFVYDDEEGLHYVGDAKLNKLIELVAASPKPLVVFTAFVPDLLRIVSVLKKEGYDVAEVYGKTKKSHRPGIWDSHQRAQHDVTVCQIRTGGVGVDLWKANTAIVHSLGHSFIDWDQAKARLDKINKLKASKIFLLCGKNTIDEEIFDLVIVKRWNGRRVLNKLKRSTTMTDETMKYGVTEMAEALGVEPMTVRAKLRKSTLTKTGKVWGWKTQKEFDAAVKTLKGSGTTEAAPAKTRGKKTETEAPAKTKGRRVRKKAA